MIGGAAFEPGKPTTGPAAGRGPGPVVDISSGPLQVRLADSGADIDAAQALRYRIFYENPGARPELETARRRRDFDRFDEGCDHLLVLDHSRGRGPENVVGTYRLIRREAAARLGGFYSAAEYDIAPLVAYRGEILELGRSCVDAAYRQRPAMQLLWSGIAAYVFYYDIALMFGCASLPGTDPEALATPLSYLHHHHLAPPALRARALADRYVEMCRLPPGAIDAPRALAALPPLGQGLSAPRRRRRRRGGDRPRVQHHGRVRGGRDRPGQRKVFASLRTPVETHQGTLGQSQMDVLTAWARRR